ncbi:pyruvate, water dikinase regulatory protein [Pontibacillus litoralis]|uniref:Putative pyruvate, phosphate dikinase regulatory protein n=1 Tax=Pontibacillus litoralis JSM 072002 TaxID=1385512 RepID=A0A0A5G6Z4_9BACI|nr:pyruvate, water dikinase regulatory protein [Pontibacillus litoralis]KGX88906.1 phosphotransferase [Pontibacillus litoralis JSM 072002]
MSKPIVYVVSDSVGETAELVVKASISQFSNSNFEIHRIPYIEDKQMLTEAVLQAKEHRALIGFTIVKPDLRAHLSKEAALHNVPAIDIVGPMIDEMEKLYNKKPRLEPGLVHKLDEDYFKRVEAIEFAVKYDDGRDPRGILKADIVLIGVSRTSKTPLSQYLAHKRLKVANVPIVPEVDPPEELYTVDPKKCIGLKISAEKLNDIRKERLKALGLDDQATYAKMERIKQELNHFHQIVNRINCEVIDVSNKAVEETANTILSLKRKKK